MTKKLQSEYKNSDTIQKIENSKPYEIVDELLKGLNKQLDSTVKEINNGNQTKAIESAKKAQRIAYALQTGLDHDQGGELAEGLSYLYSHIRFATKKYIEEDKKEFLDSAYHVSSEISQGWKGMASKVA